MSTNLFKCPHCCKEGEKTLHDKISWAEGERAWSKHHGESDFYQSLSSIAGWCLEKTGLSEFLPDDYWKCRRCGFITVRKNDGRYQDSCGFGADK